MSFTETNLKVVASTTGVTVAHTKVSGLVTRWTARGLSRGQMAGSMLESTIMTRKRGTESICGLMEGAIGASGTTANSMGKESMSQLRATKCTENGGAANE